MGGGWRMLARMSWAGIKSSGLWPAPGKGQSLLLLAAGVLVGLLPFLGKPYHIDDPLFVWCGKQIQAHPLDFYGFRLNWEGRDAAMSVVTQNPPLACYYAAFVGTLFGWSEVALHAGFLLPALALGLGTYFLARRFCAHPLVAGVLTISAPGFMLSGISVMCDTMMVAFWVWALVFWWEGISENCPTRLLLAVGLIALASLTKYFGICLVPLLLVCTWWERRRLGPWAAYLLIPILVLIGFQWLTQRMYGHGLVLSAVGYATQGRVGGDWVGKWLAGLAFTGGCMVMLLLAAPLLWGKRTWIIGLPTVAFLALLVLEMKKVGVVNIMNEGQVRWLLVGQLALFAAAGIGLICLAAADLLAHRTSTSLMLGLWVAGTLVFSCAVNWTVSGRNILPLLPATALLLTRRLERQGRLERPQTLVCLGGLLAGSAVVAMLAGWADYRLADSARIAAQTFQKELLPQAASVKFEGHWGFQYYMEQMGAKPLDREKLVGETNEVVVIPWGKSFLFPLPKDHFEYWKGYRFETLSWLATMNSGAGAGYYSDGWGPLPFALGTVPPEDYLVFRGK